jgi:hypothetical protein
MPTRCPPSGPRRGGRSRRALASPDWVAAPTGGGGSGALARAARSDSPSPAMRSAAGARALGSHPERRGKPRRAPCWQPASWLVARPVTQGPRQRATGPVIGCEAKNVMHAGAGAIERFSIAELTLAKIQIQLGEVRTWTPLRSRKPCLCCSCGCQRRDIEVARRLRERHFPRRL